MSDESQLAAHPRLDSKSSELNETAVSILEQPDLLKVCLTCFAAPASLTSSG